MLYAIVKQNSQNFRLYHKCNYRIYGAVMYGSAIYRLQYIFAALCGYVAPDNVHTERYYRPLDRFFVFSFYGIPLLLVIIYNYTCINKYRKTKQCLYIMGTIIGVLLSVLSVLGCLYHQS